ncbi:MAG: hypothetical protein JWN17_1500 [Frankiales bacterium]|nr:hypothetical protein [Frankiales bacterium]
MGDLLFGSTRPQAAAVRAAVRAEAQAFAARVRQVYALFCAATPEQREFVAGEVACLMHVSPRTGAEHLATTLALHAQPRLLSSLDLGRIGVPHALALLSEVEHLTAPHAAAVLAHALGEDAPVDEHGLLDRTPGELRAVAKRAAIRLDPELARRRHQAAKKQAGVRGRPGVDGMGQVVIDCTATEMATALAAIKGRAAAMTYSDQDLTQGQKEVAAFLHALGCDRVRVQAVIECPVERAADLAALAGAPVWTVDVRVPVAVALGLSDHPAVLRGYGPIDADQARALLPAADLVRACVNSTTGEVLTADRPVRTRTGACREPFREQSRTAGPGRDGSDQAAALRAKLITMATSGGTLPDLRTDGYVPSAALGRLVDLRDVTSVFPGDLTPARRCDRDHRLPWPLGQTDQDNLQLAARRWHRAKHSGWTTRALPDGTLRWTSPGGTSYDRRPHRTPPPPVPPDTALPPLPNEN